MIYKIKTMNILIVIVGRLIIFYLIQNYDYPDEYWQGTEIAHRIFYGYGYQTW